MSVTVVVRRQAQPGQEEALIRLAIAAIERPRARTSSVARVFQNVDDPAAMLYVGQWSSREAYESRDAEHVASLDALCQEAPARWFCQQLSLYEVVSSQVEAADCTSLRVPPAQAAAVETYLREQAAPLSQAQPGFVLRAVYQDLDDPGHLFVLLGWRSAADGEAAYQQVWPELSRALREMGAQLERFQGRTRAEIERRPRG
jgi:quinol monooxygenase YgiN